VVQIAQSMRAEGAVAIKVVTDEPEKYNGVALADGAWSITETSWMPFNVNCAKSTAVRSLFMTKPVRPKNVAVGKRGTMVDPAVRVMINELVCEGCGDCGVQSNCLSVETIGNRIWPKKNHQSKYM
jgi:indolepyruvate ferredoxin oxidoreductase